MQQEKERVSGFSRLLACVLMATALLVGRTTERAAAASDACPRQSDESVLRLQENVIEFATGKEIGFILERYSSEHELLFTIEQNASEKYIVASAFKAFLVLDYFLSTPELEWDFKEGSQIYSVAVYSNNTRTAQIMSKIAKREPHLGNAIEQFNNFLNSIGVEEGIYSWGYPATQNLIDMRFVPSARRSVNVYGLRYPNGNIFSATDLRDGYLFLARAEEDPSWENDPHFRRSIEATRALLGIQAENYRSLIDRQFPEFTHYGKDGALPVETFGFRVLSDAGVLVLPDLSSCHGFYLISYLSSGEGDVTAGNFLRMVKVNLLSIEKIGGFQDLELSGTS